MGREILGFVEKVKIKGHEVLGRVDTGARRCSIDRELAEKLKLGPIVKHKRYRSAHGRSIRPVIEEEIEIKGVKKVVRINLSNRKHMKYDFLIGREALKNGFLIDPNK
ncbi:MAG: hypothetical protein CMH63_02855 [Nanoarchaeota archaeon]|jgi:hypothetical protein|nr:hypothetical protein [Nanoarchaeota archaeon]|tara:strand:- start:2813 stop:3136 length:324 start_codon:yes stop_codon:yes gene_type:complete